MLILDGLGDEPNDALGGLTPLQAAEIPHLRMLANHGGQGRIQTTRTGNAPETHEGFQALLGASSSHTVGRGLLAAMGCGVPIPSDSIVCRGNLATCGEDGVLLDRRAGRIRDGTADLLATLKDVSLPGGIRGSIIAGHEHRVVVILQGPGLSPDITDTDPGDSGTLKRAQPAKPTQDTPEAKRTAEALNALLSTAQLHLTKHALNASRSDRGLFPANCIITRGASAPHADESSQFQDHTAGMISACPTAIGIARLFGMNVSNSSRMTGNLDTDIDEKFQHTAALFQTHSFVAIHFKGTDIAAHDQRPLEKRDFISDIDAGLGRFLTAYPNFADNLRIVVTADHGTSSRSGEHLSDPVPLLLGRWTGLEEEAEFNEQTSKDGALGVLKPGELADLLWSKDVD